MHRFWVNRGVMRGSDSIHSPLRAEHNFQLPLCIWLGDAMHTSTSIPKEYKEIAVHIYVFEWRRHDQQILTRYIDKSETCGAAEQDQGLLNGRNDSENGNSCSHHIGPQFGRFVSVQQTSVTGPKFDHTKILPQNKAIFCSAAAQTHSRLLLQ